MVQPQKRESVRECLEATLGRALEMKRWLVYLNGGLEAVSLEDALLDLGLTPDAGSRCRCRGTTPTPTRRRSRRGDRAIRGALADAKAGKFRKPNQGEPEGDPSGDAAPTSGGDPAQAPGAPGPEDSGATGSAEGPPPGVRTSGPLLDADPSKKERSYLKKMHPLSHLEPIADIDEAMMIIQRNERGRGAREG